ncbi:MAG: hypothetical protein GC162_12760 [Planctomycetes bacterium]|nr:hypothetical protein [Planctomycetota bacterium]
MALIKRSQADCISHDAIVLDLGDLRRQARVLIERAQRQADEILTNAKAEAKRLTDAASKIGHDEGFAKGKAEGFEAGRAAGRIESIRKTDEALVKLQEAWINAARQWDADRRAMLLEARQSILKLAIEMASKVVRRVPKVDASIVVDQVAEAISYVARPCDVTIRIHPDDRALVSDAMPKLLDETQRIEHATLVDDANVAPGGCVITFGKGRIDASLDKQLERLIDALLPHEARADQGMEGTEAE